MQLHQVLGFPALGWLLEKQHAGADFASEQITRLAARLCQERDQNGARVFAFTGVSKGNGTSTVVRGLTKSLTSLGVRTLAVEANTGRPDTVSGDRASRSLSVVLQGQSDLSKEVHGGNVQAIDHLAADDSSRPSDLQNLVAILRQVPDVYSMVLVDLAPVALSADAEVVARSADVVVLIGEAGRVTKKELRSAATLVERLRPAGLAAVLNRVDGSLRGSFGERASRDFYGAPFVVPSVWKSRFGWS
jgi:Mrp family chromosome partitioning ATPase